MKKGIVIVTLFVELCSGKLFSQWNKIYDDMLLSEGYFNCLEITPDSSIFYGTGKHIFKSSTLGYTWEEVYSETGATSIDCIDNDTCYCAGSYAEIGSGGVALRTYDGGDTWQIPVSFPLYEGNNIDVFALNGLQVFVCGGDGIGYVQTTDDGFYNATITIPSIGAESIGAVSCINRDTCICVAGSFFDELGEDYRVYKTSNGGETWTEDIAVNFGRDIVHINENTIYLLERWVLIKSIDGGNNWDTIKEYTGMPGSHYVAMKFVDENFGYMAEQFDVQDSIAIYKTETGGVDWTATTINEIPIGIFDIDCLNKDHCFFIGGLGEIYSTTNGGVATSIENDKSAEIKIYPNPTRNYLTLETNEVLDVTKLKITNSIGLNISYKISSENNFSCIVDLSLSNSGLYFLNYGTYSTKIIKL